MTTETEREPQGKLFDARLTRRLLAYARPYQKYLWYASGVILFMALISSYLPVLLRTAVDTYLIAEDGALSTAQRWQGIHRTSLLYLGLSLLAFACRYYQSYLVAWAGEHVIRDLRADIFAKILRLPLPFLDRTPVGRLMTRVSSDVEAMQKMVSDGLVGLLADLFSLLAIMGFMWYLSPRLALTLFGIFPLLVIVMGWINWHTRRAHRAVRRRQSTLNAYLQEMITGMWTIQLFRRERLVVAQFDQRNDDLRNGWLETIKWISRFFPSMDVLNALSTILVLLVGGTAIVRGSDVMTVGIVIAYMAYIRDFFRPLEDLSEKSNVFQSAMASAERIFSLLDEAEDVPPPAAPVSPGTLQGAIEFDRVWFAYQGEEWVLKDVSFRIEPGESIAIVGATGAGKTTIISLINRFYDVQRGHVRIDGHDICQYDPVALRQHIGVVIQDPFIFSGTIADNIHMHHPDIDRARVEEAAHYVNAHRFIEQLPQGYDTPVQERGMQLSTGQKQLIALARALVQNPDILLILDEATANIDSESERWIQEALARILRDRTSIVIAHRLSTIRGVDRILVMRQGEKTEEGTHYELLRHNGYYRRLYELLAHHV